MHSVVGYLGSDGDILPWILLIDFLCWGLVIRVLGDNRSRCIFLGLSLLDESFVPWFLVLSGPFA